MSVALGKIKAIAFDLDGTLVDSLPGLSSAVDMTLQELSLPAPGESQVRNWIGNGADVMLQRAFVWAGANAKHIDAARARVLFDRFYSQTVEDGSMLYPGVADTLRVLASHGFQMGIITNKPSPFIAPLLAALNIMDYFSVVLGGDDVKQKKPHPAPIYLMMGTLGLDRDELLFVGDSRNDIVAAKAAGCCSVGLTYGYNYGISIADSDPDYVLSQFDALLPLLVPAGK